MQAIVWLEKPLVNLTGGIEVKVIVGNLDQYRCIKFIDGQVLDASYSHAIYAEDIEATTFIVKDENGNWLPGVADART